MNVLEHYIIEIHSENPYEDDWKKQQNEKFVEIDLTTNCYGCKSRSKSVWTEKEWEQIKEQGYYMA